MAGDQVASLLVGVAADGLVDFSKAKLLDRRWNLKLLWICQSYQARKQAEIVSLRLTQMTSALDPANIELFKHAWSISDNLIHTVTELTMPWLARDLKPKKDYNVYSDLIEAYKNQFGDMDDPVWRKTIEDSIALLKSRSAQGGG